MKIRLDQVDEPFVWKETLKVSAGEFDIPELVEIGAVECRGTISPMVEISPMDESYLLRAALSYDHELRCMRCLKPVQVSSASDLELILEVSPNTSDSPSKTPEQELQLEGDDLGLLRLEDAVLDTRPLIIEQVHLSIPMKPLCKEDCAGLCASCGADLNDGLCGCETVTDPRWQALAALKRSE